MKKKKVFVLTNSEIVPEQGFIEPDGFFSCISADIFWSKLVSYLDKLILYVWNECCSYLTYLWWFNTFSVRDLKFMKYYLYEFSIIINIQN